MGFTSFNGNTSQRCNILPPIGVMVLSTTPSSDKPSSCIGATSSKERIVKRSSRTYFSSSMRASDVIWLICVCCVCSKYCIIAPAAITPLFRWSTPKPFKFFVPKCFSSFCRAERSVNTQSSISYTHIRVPK